MKKIIFLLSILFLSSFCLGQFVYHQYAPPIYTEVEECYVDSSIYIPLNVINDTVNDFIFKLSYWPVLSTPSCDEAFLCKLQSLNGSQFAYENIICTVKALSSGDTIWDNLDWNNPYETGYLMHRNCEYGTECEPFSDAKYCPVKFNIDSSFHYGWFKVRSSYYLVGFSYPGSNADLYIYEFAYNLEPNCGVIAGDTITSLINSSINILNSIESLNIYPNPATDILTIKNAENFSSIIIRDVLGDIVYKSEILNGIDQIKCSEYQEGIYLLTLSNNKEIVTRKIIIGRN